MTTLVSRNMGGNTTASKRETLLDSAKRDFEREGFRALSVDRLLRESRISTCTLYKHFDSKDHLVVEVLERRHARYVELLHETVRDAALRVGRSWKRYSESSIANRNSLWPTAFTSAGEASANPTNQQADPHTLIRPVNATTR